MPAEMTIYNRLKILIAQKEVQERRRLTYRTIAQETGIAASTISAYTAQNVTRFDTPTLNAFCKFFNCQPGDILVYSTDEPVPGPPQE